jgi:hypothetical protein
MQMLVYENYNKFIAATDTIRDMKDTVEDMEQKVQSLTESVASISTTSDSIDRNLAAGRAKIENLSGTRRLLKKIEFLFQLPSRLTKSVELKATAQAVRYYAISNRALHQYSHIPSFSAIQKEADEIIGRLKVQLRATAESTTSPAAEVTDAIQMLLDLQEPAADLRATYIRVRSAELRAALDALLAQEATRRSREAEARERSARERAAKQKDAAPPVLLLGEDPDDPEPDAMALPFIVLLARKFGALYDDFGRSYRRLFLGSEAAKKGPASTPEDRAEANRQLKACTKELFADYFALARDHLSERTWGAADMLKALERLSEDVALAHQVSPDAGLLDKKAEITEKALRGYISRRFDDVKVSVLHRFAHLSHLCGAAEGSTTIGRATEEAHSFLVDSMASVIDSLDGLVRATSRVVADYTEALQHQIHFSAADTVSYVLEVIVHLVEPAPKKPLTPGYPAPAFAAHPLLAAPLARFAIMLHELGVRKIHTGITKSFKLKDKKMQFEPTSRVSRAREIAQLCLDLFVEGQGHAIARMVRTSIENTDWLQAKEPRDVRAGAAMVTEEITRLNAFVAQLFERGSVVGNGGGAGGGTGPGGAGSGGSGNSVSGTASLAAQGLGGNVLGGALAATATTAAAAAAGKRGGIESGIARLFATKVRIFGPVVFTTASAITGIIKVAFKTLVESVRLKTFSAFGLQKVQVDVHYWRQTIAPFVSTEEIGIFHSLLDDALRSTADRCLAPMAMDLAIVEAIVAKRIASQQQQQQPQQ